MWFMLIAPSYLLCLRVSRQSIVLTTANSTRWAMHDRAMFSRPILYKNIVSDNVVAEGVKKIFFPKKNSKRHQI